MIVVSRIKKLCKRLCHEFAKVKTLLHLLGNKPLYKGQTYFPEKSRKSMCHVLKDQAVQIMKYGAPEHFYFMYGLDYKSDAEYDSYVNYLTFMERRNFLNYESHPQNNTCCILRNKFLFSILCGYFDIPTPTNLYYFNGAKLNEFVDNKLVHVPYSRLTVGEDTIMFCKRIDGECGRDVFVLERRNNCLFFNEKMVCVDTFLRELRGADYLFQKLIIQHPEMERLNPSSVNTIRLTTVRNLKTGEIKVWPSALRIGVQGSYIDNLSQGGMIVGIDINSGRLCEYGFQRPEFGGRTNRHPDTNVSFKDFSIPFFEVAKEKAQYLHSLLRDIHSIGWDIAITADGPLFIEGNDNWEITISQAANHGLRREFDEDFYY